jgi:hypothetical protein
MKKLVLSLLVLILTVFMANCATMQGPGEGLDYPLPTKKHKYVKTFTLKDAYLTTFVYEGKSIDDWTEGLEIFNTWRKNYPPTPEEAYNSAIEARKKQCPESTINLISKDSKSILYEVRTINCPPQPDQNSIMRILYGNTDVFVPAYTIKKKDIPRETRDEWIRILSEAYIMTYSK